MALGKYNRKVTKRKETRKQPKLNPVNFYFQKCNQLIEKLKLEELITKESAHAFGALNNFQDYINKLRISKNHLQLKKEFDYLTKFYNQKIIEKQQENTLKKH